MYRVDLNSDLGESFGPYTMGCDELVLREVTSANVACGWHGGDPLVLDKTLAAAKREGVAVGAHPGFPDLLGFGRREMKASPEEVRAYVLYQLGAFAAFAGKHGLQVQHLKAHGALYNMAARDMQLAMAVAQAVKDFDPEIVLVGLAGSCLLKAGRVLGLQVASEAFADRAYEPDGSLMSRKKPGAVLTEEEMIVRRAVRMVKEGLVTAADGTDIPVQADTLCVHGDNPQAVALTHRLRAALTAEGVALMPLGRIVG